MHVPAAWTDDAAKMECSQCTHGARCVTSEEEEQGNSVLLDESQDKEGGELEPKVVCSCQHYKCTGLALRTLCATNGVTYSSECHMRREACQLQNNIYKLHSGHCRSDCKLVIWLHLSLSLSLSLTNMQHQLVALIQIKRCYLRCTLCEERSLPTEHSLVFESFFLTKCLP